MRHVRCSAGGALVDDVDYYNRVHETMSILTSMNNRDSDDCEGLGYRWDDDDHYVNFDELRFYGYCEWIKRVRVFQAVIRSFQTK